MHMATKDEIRKQMREQRRHVDETSRKTTGKAVCEKVIGHPVNLLTRAWRVCIYLSVKSEVPTRYIARALWDAGREVCVPAWSRSEQTYKLYAITPKTKFVEGKMGVREPLVREPVLPWEVDAFIIPGLAFDRCGGRLGYGAGYYDQILSKAAKSAPKIALCHDWQLRDEPLPQDEHDIPVDWVLSETHAVNCAANRLTRTRSPS